MTAKWQYKYAYEGALITIGTLKDENAKLRELVEGAVEAAELDDVRDWSIGHRLRLIRQARELGIEVGDGDGI